MGNPQLDPLPDAQKDIVLETVLGSKAPTVNNKEHTNVRNNRKTFVIFAIATLIFLIYIIFLVGAIVKYA